MTAQRLPDLVRREGGERRAYFGWDIAADLLAKGVNPIHWQRAPKLWDGADAFNITEGKRPQYVVVTVGCDAGDDLLTQYVRNGGCL